MQKVQVLDDLIFSIEGSEFSWSKASVRNQVSSMRSGILPQDNLRKEQEFFQVCNDAPELLP